MIANITNAERQQLRQVLQMPQWKTVERLAELLISQIQEQPAIAETQWMTLQNLLSREGEVRGIRRLIQEMYNQAQLHD